jgi:hypothetical protein
MALVDFHQLAILFRLARCNGDTLSTQSHPLPMPAPMPLDSSTRAGTPLPYGSAAIHKLEPDPGLPKKCVSSKYEEYIAQDYDRHRVFVDIEDFMRCVLHVPDDWKEVWKKTIQKVVVHPPFCLARAEYSHLCQTGALEVKLYKPLVDMVNAIFGITESPESDESVKPVTPLRYFRGNSKGVLGGIMPELSPDVIAVHKDFLSHIPPDEQKDWALGAPRLTWAQPMQILEVKPSGSTLINGSAMPRLKVNGELTTPVGMKD